MNDIKEEMTFFKKLAILIISQRIDYDVHHTYHIGVQSVPLIKELGPLERQPYSKEMLV